MFDDYRKTVFAAYKEKRDNGSLSPNLLLPSPAKIKAECLIVYKERFLAKDQETLRAFFGARNDSNDYSLNIRNIDIDRFRPLVNFIKGKSTPDDRIVELLAWLLDFNPRPYAQLNKPQEVKTEEEVTLTELNKEGSVEKHDREQRPNQKIKMALLSFAVLIVMGGFYFFYNKNQKCMYWTGEQYEQVECDIKIENNLITAMDTAKLSNMRRITRPDTLSSYSIRKVWYAKNRGKIEFFTDSGSHPLDYNKRMLPMTQYIYDKYVLANK